jgi:hypothetical protein
MARETNQQKQAEISELLPALAMTALKNASGNSGASDALFTELLEDIMEERRKKKARAEKLRLNSVDAAKEESRIKSIEKRNCSHRDQRDHTRLSGQYLSGTGQLCLVCKWCGKEYHHPPNAALGQESPPRELMPSRDELGG